MVSVRFGMLVAIGLCLSAVAAPCAGDLADQEAGGCPLDATSDASLLQTRHKTQNRTDGRRDDEELRRLADKLLKAARDEADEEAERADDEVHDAVMEVSALGLDSKVSVSVSVDPPTGIERVGTSYDWCDCGTGRGTARFWADGDTAHSATVGSKEAKWIKFGRRVTRISWVCDGMEHSSWSWEKGWHTTESVHTSHIDLGADEWLSLRLSRETKDHGFCNKASGRLSWNTWRPTGFVSSVPFTTGTEGYACFKIPAMLTTQAGTVIAFAEARTPDCDDFARTDTVYKRSTDGGRTWGPLQKLVDVPGDTLDLGECDHHLVIGNIAPVQLRQDSKRHPGRILVPYTRNNFRIYLVHSDDDGMTFKGDRELKDATRVADRPECQRSMKSYFGLDVDRLSIGGTDDLARWVSGLCKLRNPYHDPAIRAKLTGPWQFVGMGPPGSVQLRSGRVVAPGYRSYIRGLDHHENTLPTSQLYNNFAVGFVIISDDEGETWRLQDFPVGEGGNEHQLVELAGGSALLSNSRALATGSQQSRLQSWSRDSGETWAPSGYVPELPQPFNGCQGSTVGAPGNKVYSAVPDPPRPSTVVQQLTDSLGCGIQLTGRRRLTLFESSDGGVTYPKKHVIDQGLSAQTSLQHLGGKLVVLYEQADPLPATPDNLFSERAVGDLRVLLPNRFVYRELDPLLH